MAKLEDIDPTLSPIVIAAMLDDDEPESAGDESSQATDEETNEELTEDLNNDAEVDQPEEGNEVDSEPSTEKEELTDEDTNTVEEDEDHKPTRKEKREVKRQRYLDTIRKEGKQNTQRNNEDLFHIDTTYKPLDYTSSAEIEVEDLSRDREQYGQNNFSKGVKLAERQAEQQDFYRSAEYEDKLLHTDPKYAFLNENDPDHFDEDRTAELSDLFLGIAGYDPETKTVQRTDLSWGNFVKAEVARMERWQMLREADITSNFAAQRSTTSIRPGGSPAKRLGKIRPGDIAKMSQAEFAKNEAEIDRQILAELGN